MKYARRNILSSLVKAPVLFLYISFFAVELFFNFDFGNNSGTPTFLLSYSNVASRHSFAGKEKTNKAKEKKQTTRLNKRFEPQTILAYNRTDIKSPVYFLETKTFLFYSDVCIPASFLLPQSFRGPPVVA